MNLLLKNFMLAIITISIYKYFEKIIDYMFSFLKLFNINYVGKYDAIMFQETNNYVPVLIFLFIWLLIFILNYKTKNKIRNNLDLSFLSLMVIILGTKNLIFARMSIYYFSSIILFLPMTSKVFREANGIEIYILIMSLLSIYSYVN